jgi:hypothetical protein
VAFRVAANTATARTGAITVQGTNHIVAQDEAGSGVTCGSWQAVTNNAGGQHLFGIVWGGGKFVAVGTGGTIVTSPDGLSWTRQSSSTNEFLVRVAHGGGRYVAVGHNGTVVTSNDGVSWSPRSVPTSQNLVDVAWVNNRFIATGTNGVILESTDGLSWASRSSGTTYVLNGATWTGSRYVVIGASPDFSDGIALVGNGTTSWSVWPSGQPIEKALFGSASNGTGTTVAVGKSGYIVVIDPDTSSPNRRNSPTTKELYDVDSIPGLYAVVGAGGVTLFSNDGLTWQADQLVTTRPLYGVALGDGINVAVGQIGTTIRQVCSP